MDLRQNRIDFVLACCSVCLSHDGPLVGGELRLCTRCGSSKEEEEDDDEGYGCWLSAVVMFSVMI